MSDDNDFKDAKENSQKTLTRAWRDVYSKIDVDLHASASTYIYGVSQGQSVEEIVSSAVAVGLLTQFFRALTSQEKADLRVFFAWLETEGGTVDAERIYAHMFSEIKEAKESGHFWREARARRNAAGVEGMLPSQNRF